MNDFSNIEAPKDQEETKEQEELEELEEVTIGKVIDCFLHRILDIEECAAEFITQAHNNYNQNADRLKAAVKQCQELMETPCERDNSLAAIRELRKLMRETDRHNNSSPVETIEKSLFINLFACLDKFVGDLLSALYISSPELYKNINREVPLSEVLKFDSMENLKEAMLNKEVETLRRKSYIEQFNDLEKKFSIALKKFDKWPEFVECSQRRNLFTHCDGVVSKQYIDICSENNCKFGSQPKIGDQLSIGAIYFFKSCQTITEVAVMLGQTLWRKTNNELICEADSHLNSLIFDFLHMEDWAKAISLSKFALNLPKHSGDQISRMFHVNYAIALKGIGETKAAKKILDRKDWSTVSYDFRIAYAVLSDDYATAKDLMIKIGQNGDLVTEMAYHEWPLFREFRETTDFFEGYEEVFGYKYATKLRILADKQAVGVIDQESQQPVLDPKQN